MPDKEVLCMLKIRALSRSPLDESWLHLAIYLVRSLPARSLMQIAAKVPSLSDVAGVRSPQASISVLGSFKKEPPNCFNQPAVPLMFII